MRKRFLKIHVLQRLCGLADEKTNCGNPDGLRLAQLCCRLAQQLKTEEALVLSFARLATALRSANRLEHAERALEIALDVAPLDLEGDLHRRRAWIRIYQDRLKDAIDDAEAALERTEGAEMAMAHEALGVALLSSGKHQEGLRQVELCLAATDPDAETAYCNALHNYATALGEGTDEQATEALILCADLRLKLKDRHKLQRAMLWWTEGLLHERLDDTQQAWRSLDTARRSLIALRVAAEAAAIVADMARVASKPLAVRHICGEAEAVIRAPHPLIEPLRELATAGRE
ncbi:MAG: hypothetical protein GY719_30465, partial [bacterium]|nr:hypothetical protein [bacterium]